MAHTGEARQPIIDLGRDAACRNAPALALQPPALEPTPCHASPPTSR
ncbi:hypothetical protein C7S16_6998 [Burkholderia thailandensis]|uniref:Uncharacterized protein n=1 Tax=Burkholderia thailandensis TaxID=57975 RepID=A0AAW9CKE6_BURTH|nr:hypothetical protein [Burkholderia thailandensis]MDW9251485.1 hypothetical protein [Burkholderia thailandensis]